MLLPVLLLLVGFVLLYFGADWLVRGAAHIANALGISKSVVGLTLVAFGTSAPEFFVNVIAGWDGETGIALANISGSNLTNICIGFGLTAILAEIVVQRASFRGDLIMLVVSAAVVFGLLTMDLENPALPFWSCLPLIALLVVYLYSMKGRKELVEVAEIAEEGEPPRASRRRLAWNCGVFLAGVLLLYGGGEAVLNGAVAIGKAIGIKPEVIGLTIIAAGTSIPDALASFIAARRKEHGIAVGNLLGSNISNIVFILSSTMLASRLGGKAVEGLPGSLGASVELVVDYGLVVLISAVFFAVVSYFGRLPKWAGAGLIVVYFCYMAARVYIEVAA